MTHYTIPKINTEYYTIPAIDTTYYSVGEVSTTFYVVNAFACFWNKIGIATWLQLKILGIGEWVRLYRLPFLTRYYIIPKPDTTFYEV